MEGCLKLGVAQVPQGLLLLFVALQILKSPFLRSWLSSVSLEFLQDLLAVGKARASPPPSISPNQAEEETEQQCLPLRLQLCPAGVLTAQKVLRQEVGGGSSR